MFLSKNDLLTVEPQPLSIDPRLFQCIYRYSHASKRFVEVYLITLYLLVIFYCRLLLKDQRTKCLDDLDPNSLKL